MMDQSFLHVSHILQKLPKPNRFLHAMASGHVLCLRRRQYNGWLLNAFLLNVSNADKDTHHVVDRRSFASPIQSFEGMILKSNVPFKYLKTRFTAIQRWIGFRYELAHHTHRNISPHDQHCIHERSYLGLIWNTFHFPLHIPKFLIQKFSQFC